MTLPADRIGDKGQRYEVRGYLDASDEVEVIGYAADIPAANRLVAATRLWPRYDAVWWVDREPAPTINECSDLTATEGGADHG